MDQPGWELRLTRTIASQTRTWRVRRGLSAQALADRAAALGVKATRSLISDLENGRRESVRVAELFAIARVLDVGPADLLATEAGMEAAQGSPMPRESAAAWLGSLHCPACTGRPPAGFTCNECGKAAR